MAQIFTQPQIPEWLQADQRVRISFVPGAIENVALGDTGVVVGKPRVIRGNVDVELLLDDGRKLVWKLDALEPIEEKEQREDSETVAETVATKVVLPEELTPEEERERLRLERQVERSIFQAGRALKELRDQRLYRSSHKTFEEYCRDRFGFTRMAASYKISAAVIVDNLSTIGLQNQEDLEDAEMSTIGLQILPTSERQVRPLVGLEPEVQRYCWQQAVAKAGSKVPSGRIVKDVVQRIREKTPRPNPYRVGEICKLIVKGNPDLRGKGGCWCLVDSVYDFSCRVRTWDGSHQVKIENLKSLDLFPEQQQKLQKLLSRLIRLRQMESLESSVVSFLSELGKKTTLTDLEEKMLNFLESYHGLG